MSLKFTVPEMQAYLHEIFPQLGPRFEVLALAPHAASLRLDAGEQDLRPGGTVSGPAMFALADCTFYVATLAMIGREALTVTTSAQIDFMRKPRPGALTAEARILKLGRVLSVGDVLLYSEKVEGPIARASMTYSIPPKKA